MSKALIKKQGDLWEAWIDCVCKFKDPSFQYLVSILNDSDIEWALDDLPDEAQ